MMTITLLLGLMAAPQEKATAPSYGEVHALFVKYCIACHDRKEAEADLILESYATLMKGSENGAVVVAGNPDKSLLQRVIERKEKPYMPPKKSGKKMAPAEIALLRAWIKAGAAAPTKGETPPAKIAVPKIKPLVKPRRAIHALAYEPRLRMVATGRPGEVELRSIDHRGIVRKLTGHAGNVNDLAFSRGGDVLAAAAGRPGERGEVVLWSPSDGKKLHVLSGHEDAVYSVAVSPDALLIASGSYDQKIILWETATGKKVRELTGHNAAVFDLDFRPDGMVLASVSGDRSVKLWSVPDGKRLDTLTESTKDLHAVAFSPDGKRVAAAGVDNRIRVWRVGSAAKEGTNAIERTQFAHEGTILALRFSPDGKTVVSSADDRTVKLSDGTTFAQRRSLERQPDWPSAVTFALEGRAVVVGRLDGSIAYYETATGKKLPLPKPEIVRHAPRGLRPGDSVAVQVWGKNLASVTETWSENAKLKVKLVDARSGKAEISVHAAKDLAPGAYSLKLKGRGGETRAFKVHLDTLAQAGEQEPNDRLERATALTMPASVWGRQDKAGDRDHFVFNVNKGQRIVLDLSARRLGSKTEAVVTLLDLSGRVVATNIDYQGHQDPVVVYTSPHGGRYVAQVSDLQMASSDAHFYRLSVGTLPVVTGCTPLSVPANRESVVTLIGENLPKGATAVVKAGPSGEAVVPVDPWEYRTRKALKVIVSNVPEAVEAEPNGVPAEAARMAAPGSANGRIGKPGDVDLFQFGSGAGEKWVIETHAARAGSPVDTRIEILDAAGKPVDRVMLRAVLDSYVTFRPVDANGGGVRLPNWEEVKLNQYLYMNGEVVKMFLAPRGPDSTWDFYRRNGRRRCYFGTSATAHPLDEPCYIVEPHPPGTKLPENGLPCFTLTYSNDDDSDRKLGSDSRLIFTAPKDGVYLVRVSDSRGAGGERNVYRLLVRRAKPDFTVKLTGQNPRIPVGGGRNFTVQVDRVDGFEGPVQVDLTGLPPGFTASTPIVVEAGHTEAKGTVFAAPDAARPTKENAGKAKLTATAVVAGKKVTRDVNSFGKMVLGGPLKVNVKLDPVDASTGNELVIPAGGQVQAILEIARDGFDDRVTFDVENLPHGVIVMDIGLNGILIPEKQTRRRIFIQCADWVKPQTRVCHARAREVGNPTSKPIVLRVVEAAAKR